MKQKTLHLTLGRRWFLMILSGVKKEEYRELKPYWVTRIFGSDLAEYMRTHADIEPIIKYINDGLNLVYNHGNIRLGRPRFTHIKFTNGYARNAPTFTIELKGIRIGVGNPEWGATPVPCFILSLGEIVDSENIKTT